MRHTTLRAARFVLPASLLLLASCATAGATFNSGVAPKSFEHPPYYNGGSIAGGARIAHLPIAYQRGAAQSPIFEPKGGDGSGIAALLADMNAYLDSLGATARIAPPATGTPPDVRFGCMTDASGDCVEDSTDVGGRYGRPGQDLHLEIGRPSQEWAAAAASAMQGVGAEGALLITLEIGHYWTRQTNLRGDKQIELGTGHTVGLPWLTSLETPVMVLQLTGALVGTDGRATRIGAEGMLARRSNLVTSALGAQRLITDEDAERLRTLRREDLPGQPLVWQVALRNMVAQLTGKNQ